MKYGVLGILLSQVVFGQNAERNAFQFLHHIEGASDDEVMRVALGADGSLFVAGLTASENFETTPGAPRPPGFPFRVRTERQVFLRKLSADGSKLLYSMLLGFADDRAALSLAVDREGVAYVAARTWENEVRGMRIYKVAPDGTQWEGFGGVADSSDVAIAAASNGEVYAATGSGAIELARFDGSGRLMGRRTISCLQGSMRTLALAIGPDGSLYLGGRAACSSFPATSGAFRPATSSPGREDGFVMRLDASIGIIHYATLVGDEVGSGNLAMAVGTDGSAVVVGTTVASSPLGAGGTVLAGVSEWAHERATGYGYVGRIAADGGSMPRAVLVPSVFLNGVALTADGDVFVAGRLGSGATMARLAGDLDTLRHVVMPGGWDVQVRSLAAGSAGLYFGGHSRNLHFPRADPRPRAFLSNGFFGAIRAEPEMAALGVTVKAEVQNPQQYLSYTRCRYEITNRGPAEATDIQLTVSIGNNARFALWQADQPIFNVDLESNVATVKQLAAGESAAIEFLSNNLIFSNGITCTGLVHSSAAELHAQDNSAASSSAPRRVFVTLSMPQGMQVRRDDWPLLAVPRNFPRLQFEAYANGTIRFLLPSPQNDSAGRPMVFSRWSDGSTENPRIFQLGEENVFLSAQFSIAPAGTVRGAGYFIPEQMGEVPVRFVPEWLPAGSAETTMIVEGSGFRDRWQVVWNGQPRETEFLNPYQLRFQFGAEDLRKPGLFWISVRDRENGKVVRASQAFWVYLAVRNRMVVSDELRQRLWVSSPGEQGGTHRILLIDPESGEAERSVEIEDEPFVLALSDDGAFLYVSTANRISRWNTETMEMDRAIPIPAPAAGSRPLEVSSMLAVPGRPDLLLVAFASGPNFQRVLLFDGEAAAPQDTAPVEGPTRLLGWLDERTALGTDGLGKYLRVTVDGGVRIVPAYTRQTSSVCQLEDGLLYCGSGLAMDASTGAYVRQYGAAGAVAVLPVDDEVVFLGTGSQSVQVTAGTIPRSPLKVLRRSTGEFVRSRLIPYGGPSGLLIRSGKKLVLPGGGPGQGVSSVLGIFELPE